MGARLILRCRARRFFGNVALLIFARTIGREEEIAIRNALGASRRRIATQLFIEVLVLAAVGAAAGLALAAFVWRWGLHELAAQVGRLPFWIDPHLSVSAVVYALLLTLLGAAIAGIVPALKVTRALGGTLRTASAGATSYRFGGVWTVVIVAQVASTVAFPVSAFYLLRDAGQIRSVDPGLQAEQYLGARLELGDRLPHASAGAGAGAAEGAPSGGILRLLKERVEGESSVRGVTFSTLLPRMDHPPYRIEIDAPESRQTVGHCAGPLRPEQWDCVSSASVASDYFEVVGAPVIAGRGFDPADISRPVAIVNRSLVDQVFGDRNAVGRRVRYLAVGSRTTRNAEGVEASEWFEIVGVVPDLGMTDGSDPGESGAGIYHPISVDGGGPLHMLAHVEGDPYQIEPRLRAIAASVHPELQLHDPVSLSDVNKPQLRVLALLLRMLMAVSGIALALALMGIYAVLSFAVAQRTREIGIRLAVGGSAQQVISAVFRRPLVQIGYGIEAGGTVVIALTRVIGGLTATHSLVVVAYSLGMSAVFLLACVVPTRRALAVQPTRALRGGDR